MTQSRQGRVSHRLALDDEALLAFWRERHLGTLTTLRPDGTPHVTPAGVTLDALAGLARVICAGGSRKATHVRAAGSAGLAVAVCQVDGRRWSTLEGTAHVVDDPARIAEAERRYAKRYRPPRPNPERVVIEIAINRVLGHV